MILIDLPPWVLYGFLFVLGSIVGSFLNVCIYRLPQREGFWESIRSLYDSPSHCRRCQTRILWQDNIPIVGWLRLKGRCRTCRAWISPRYPLIELLSAVLFVVVFWFEIGWGVSLPIKESCIYSPIGPQAIPGLGPLTPTQFALLRYMYHMVLIEALVVASFIDLDLLIIPDGATLPALAVGILGGLSVGRVNLVPVWFEHPSLLAAGPPAVPAWVTDHPSLHGLAVSVAGLVVGGGMVWCVRILGQWALKQEAMGFGDVILMAMIGSFLGWQPMLIIFFVAPVIALAFVVIRLVGRLDRVIPYGPYLSLAALVTILFWQSLWPGVERITGLGLLLIPIAVAGSALLAVCLVIARALRKLLGIPDEPGGFPGWTAADQNQFLSGEQVDPYQGRWRPRANWPGEASGRGQGHLARWLGR